MKLREMRLESQKLSDKEAELRDRQERLRFNEAKVDERMSYIKSVFSAIEKLKV